MNENRLMRQVTVIFSTFMVIIYLGFGTLLLYYSGFNFLNKATRGMVGYLFIFYGIYRAYKAYVDIVEVFFTKGDNDE